MLHIFKKLILHWNFTQNDRKLPWKGEKDPYKIWLSEIILQQTRSEQGLHYYQKFIKKYPTVKKLANASLQELMADWQGLGYYSRCRNLHLSAQVISKQYKNKFPQTYSDILSLKGVGKYTAAAIASFAYNLPHAVLDGNVYRVLSRYFGDYTPIDSTAGKKKFEQLAQDCLDQSHAASYNQAIMDFGATVCKPKSPDCGKCLLNESCVAYNSGTVAELPVKAKKLKRKNRFFHYLVISDTKGIYIKQRLEKDIWQQLYTFYCIETENAKMPESKYFCEQNFISYQKQVLTHQDVHAYFYKSTKGIQSFVQKEGLTRVDMAGLQQYAFPKVIADFIKTYIIK